MHSQEAILRLDLFVRAMLQEVLESVIALGINRNETALKESGEHQDISADSRIRIN